MLAAFLCAASIISMVIALAIPKTAEKGEFVPPVFDTGATVGTPDVPDNMGYIEPYANGMSFRAAFCGEMLVRDGKADVYFTNKAENDVWLMLRITDESGDLLAQTGLVRSGEYVKSITFEKIPKDGQKVVYRVMAYEPETYYSKGYFTVKTVAHVAE
jgi:hypothetical protein